MLINVLWTVILVYPLDTIHLHKGAHKPSLSTFGTRSSDRRCLCRVCDHLSVLMSCNSISFIILLYSMLQHASVDTWHYTLTVAKIIGRIGWCIIWFWLNHIGHIAIWLLICVLIEVDLPIQFNSVLKMSWQMPSTLDSTVNLFIYSYH